MKRKKKQQSFYIFGKNPVAEYLSRKPEQVLRVLISDSLPQGESSPLMELAKKERIPVSKISKKNFSRYVGDVSHQGVVALVKTFPYLALEDFLEILEEKKGTQPLVLILDHIQDPHNFGAIVRTAVAAGIDGIIIPKDNQAPVNGTVFKTSAGTILSIPIVRVANISHAIGKLRKKDFWVASFDTPEDEDTKPYTLYWNSHLVESPMVFVFGSEGKGVSERVKKESDFIFSIPMDNGVESLNVSVSVAVALYEWKRQKVMGYDKKS